MGLFFGASQQQQSPPAGEMRSMFPGLPMVDYMSWATGDLSARQSIAVRTSIDLLCSLASELPIHVYSGEGKDRKERSTPSNVADPGGDGYGLEDWIYQLNESWMYRGNAYGREIEWDSRGRTTRIELFHPDDVSVTLEKGRPRWSVNGAEVPRQDLIVHTRVAPVAGRLLGPSVIEQHALQIGTSLAAANFGSRWFKDGAHPSALLTNSEPIDAEQAAAVKKRWMSVFTGKREPAVMGKGWDYKPIQISPNESQFLETQKFSEAQCARMFGPAVAETLGYDSGGSMTYANVVDRRSDLLTFSLGKWLRRTERLLGSLLPSPQYVRFDRDALLASATLARYEAHQSALANRWKTVNEVRDDEDMAPVPWGDEPNAPKPAPVGG